MGIDPKQGYFGHYTCAVNFKSSPLHKLVRGAFRIMVIDYCVCA